jgi:cobalt-precorrin 5A hydrolase/precorrin-3B C17-methyltransferase
VSEHTGGRGRLCVVGIGPGDPAWCTPEVTQRLRDATDLVGYQTYLDLLPPRSPGQADQQVHVFDNREEAERARVALDLAASGRDVVVVSSGDPGVFAMATAVIEQLALAADVAGRTDERAGTGAWSEVDVDVLPGVTASLAASARVGAIMGHDHCLISLSDNLKPWAVIEQRLDAAARADFVIALYNPISRHRPWQLGRAIELVGTHRSPDTPVVVGHDVGRAAETVAILTLAALPEADVDMRTVVIIGSSTTRTFRYGDREWVYTPRSYPEPKV